MRRCRFGKSRYRAELTGRQRGAIGIFYPIRASVEAGSLEEAERKVREMYETGPVTKGAKRGQMYLRIKRGAGV